MSQKAPEQQDIHIVIADDPDHEKVYAEIFIRDKFVALVSQEKGLDVLEVEFPGPGLMESQILRRVGLAEFQKALTLATERLRASY